MSKTTLIRLQIPADEYLRVYQGSARYIQTMSTDGKTVRFPASILQAFVTREGVYGEFLITYNNDNRFLNIERRKKAVS